MGVWVCALNLIENNCVRGGKVDEHTNDSARMVSVRLLLTQLNIQRQHSNYKWILARHYTNETMQLQQHSNGFPKHADELKMDRHIGTYSGCDDDGDFALAVAFVFSQGPVFGQTCWRR